MGEESDPRGATQHPGAHLVTSTVLNPSSMDFRSAEPRGARFRRSDRQKSKLEGMLRKERVKECYQLAVQVSDQVRPADEEDKRRLKKRAYKLAKYASDKREDLRGMGANSMLEERRQVASRAPSRGMDTARSALSHYNVLARYKAVRDKRKLKPAPLGWIHASEGAMDSREVFKEREREAGIRNDRPITADVKQGCSVAQAGAMVRERLRSLLMNNLGAVRQVFEELDQDNDGVLNPQEFHAALQALGLPLNKQESLKFMQRFLDQSGGKRRQQIDFADFFTKVIGLPHNMRQMGPRIGAKLPKPQDPSDKTRMTSDEARRWFLAQIRLQVLNVPHCLSRVFSVMDPDHSGSIDTEELREGLRKIGLWLKEDELRQLFAVYDEDQSGAIDYKEFIAEILGIPSLKQIRKKNRQDGPSTPSSSADNRRSEKGTIRARELQCIIRQKLERAIADPGHLRDVFSRIDLDGSGVITYDDFSACCDGFGMIVSPEIKSQIFEQLDPGAEGFLTYSDFINHVALVPHDIVDIPHPQAPEARVSTPQVLDELRDRIKEKIMCRREAIEELFLSFNLDNRKSISYGGFQNTLKQLGLPLKEHHIAELWKQWVRPGNNNKIDLSQFVDQVLQFSLTGRPLSTTPISGYPVGTSMPDPVPKLKPTFDSGHTTIHPGQPHLSLNSTRKNSKSRLSTVMTPFSDHSTRPATAPAKKPSGSSARGVSSHSARSWTPSAALVNPQGLTQHQRTPSAVSGGRTAPPAGFAKNTFASLSSLKSTVTPKPGSAGGYHWGSSSKITA
eukprot:TRINITY_DN19286_c0_g1_i7.p1 TRINITY_DN19286_c0_g1~~TRINITY_DN19286_c0_g1_i7.p1  ORF type:complete len:790 (+),score=187.85 TRINITY_DN19286_c0_g1_i7:59-2428(+)